MNVKLQPLLEIAELSKSTYYYVKGTLSQTDKYDYVKISIMEIFNKHKGRYGYRRITKTLRNDYSIVINHKTVRKLMSVLGITCRIRVKKYKSYKGTVGKIAPNLLDRDFSTKGVNEKWVTDITEFKICNSKVYLSPLIDLHTKEVISYKIGSSPNLKLVLDMIIDVINNKDHKELIVHSDQGWHYQHASYRQELKDAGIKQSMSRKGNCLDNSLAENFFSHLKSEFYYIESFDSIEEFISELHEYIRYYNNDRISLKIKGMTPVQYRNHSLAA